MAVAWERKASAPILPEHLWHHRVRGLTLIARLLFAASLFGMYFMTTQYFELTLGYSALTAVCSCSSIASRKVPPGLWSVPLSLVSGSGACS